MFNNLSYTEFLELSKKSNRVVYYQEIPADMITPVFAYEALGKETAGGALLESDPKNGTNNRFSYICLHPYYKLYITDKDVIVDKNKIKTKSNLNFLEALRVAREENKCISNHPLASFVGGAVGLVNYDAIRLFENIPDRHPSEGEKEADIVLNFYGTNIIFDHKEEKAVISTLSIPENDLEKSYALAKEKVDSLIAKISNFKVNFPSTLDYHQDGAKNKKMDPTVSIDDETFKQKIIKAKEYISNGDCFQIVLSRYFSIKYTAKPFSIYRALRITNPSPYMFFIESGDSTIIGSSPEKLVSLENKNLNSCAIAGTRPRGKTDIEDSNLKENLISDAKENAEHVMLVDLARNDIGSISIPGSVKVRDYKAIRNFSSVMHMTSLIDGTLREGKDIFDVLKAVFPAGTVSGAPKIRAMERIDELEDNRRGLYAGAILLMDSKGNSNSCIVIRTAILKDGEARVQAGAGIVFDSNPQSEADETRHKASAVLKAIELAGKGLL